MNPDEYPSGTPRRGGSEIRRLAAALSDGRTSSSSLVQACLDRINDPAGEGSRTFIKIWEQEAREVAAGCHDPIRQRALNSPVAGLPISVKDLFDVKGEITRAGTKARDDAAPAEQDAPVISRLRAAGAVLVGRTNMTQFAYSAVGLNPYFGTPGNPWNRTCTPGGSSSGAAVSVADHMCIAAIGSDTVGSIRVPAALCGIVGFKPTQHRVPRQGAVPLSTTLDTIGPLARSVEDCALVYSVIASEVPMLATREVSELKIAIPKGGLLEALDPQVSSAFARACTLLSQAGARLTDIDTAPLAELQALNPNATIQAVEAMAWHRDLIARRGDDYDPNVKSRIEAGAGIAAIDYVDCLMRRNPLSQRLDRLTAEFDGLIMPTVPMIAPSIAACEREEGNIRARLIRNTSPLNYLDRPAISIPIHEPESAPIGLMIIGAHDRDWELLSIARSIEACLGSKFA